VGDFDSANLTEQPLRYAHVMESEDFVRLVETLAEAETGSLRMDSELEQFGWDSLCVIGLISELDRLNLNSVSADSIAQSGTIQELHASIFGHEV